MQSYLWFCVYCCLLVIVEFVFCCMFGFFAGWWGGGVHTRYQTRYQTVGFKQKTRGRRLEKIKQEKITHFGTVQSELQVTQYTQ